MEIFHYLYALNSKKSGDTDIASIVKCRCHKATEDQSDMMTTKETGSESGRDTTMCGGTKTWFPMRVAYPREMKVKAELDRLGIENFLPMRYKVVESQNDEEMELRRVLVPAVSNLIFVRSTQNRVSELKRRSEVLEPLRYMMDHTADESHTIMTLADG